MVSRSDSQEKIKLRPGDPIRSAKAPGNQSGSTAGIPQCMSNGRCFRIFACLRGGFAPQQFTKEGRQRLRRGSIMYLEYRTERRPGTIAVSPRPPFVKESRDLLRYHLDIFVSLCPFFFEPPWQFRALTRLFACFYGQSCPRKLMGRRD
ncbi:hypothetical protein KM043_007159 [Ampulex compressa]|nr:hypothetical protein KM043_007159 [Ampulex compressa]